MDSTLLERIARLRMARHQRVEAHACALKSEAVVAALFGFYEENRSRGRRIRRLLVLWSRLLKRRHRYA